MKRFLAPAIIAAALSAALGWAQSPYQSSADFAKYAMKVRENSLLELEPRVIVPTESTRAGVRGLYPWKLNIVTTVFWVGESATRNNPVHNFSSSWDINWHTSFGGFDDPDTKNRRRLPEGGTIPARFVPQQNPFYIALPYNDVSGGRHKPEARTAIPWFRQVFEREGLSVLKDRWIAVRKGGRVCYAQWSDCGPFRTDHWQYVFGSARPTPNLNKGAGLDVSPAVRDFLGISGLDVVDWKFVEFKDIPPGPWSRFGENNTFVIEARRTQTRIVKSEGKPKRVPDDLPLPKKDEEPVVITK